MQILARFKYLLIAIASLGLGVGSIYSAWYAKYDMPEPSTEPSYAITTDGKRIDLSGMDQTFSKARENQVSNGILLAGLGISAGVYLLRNDYKLGYLGSVTSILGLVIGLVLTFAL